MPSFACSECGKVSPLPRCPAHRKAPGIPGGWSPGRSRSAQARFRRQVLERDGYQCVVIENDFRCTGQPLQAHHTEPGNDDPATGRTLCRKHHRAIDSHAR